MATLSMLSQLFCKYAGKWYPWFTPPPQKTKKTQNPKTLICLCNVEVPWLIWWNWFDTAGVELQQVRHYCHRATSALTIYFNFTPSDISVIFQTFGLRVSMLNHKASFPVKTLRSHRFSFIYRNVRTSFIFAILTKFFFTVSSEIFDCDVGTLPCAI